MTLRDKGYLGMAMLYIFWTQEDLQKFRREFYQAKKWNCYIMASVLQKLNQAITFNEERYHDELYSWIELAKKDNKWRTTNLPRCPEGCDAHDIFDGYV